jgi:hypothetical protein
MLLKLFAAPRFLVKLTTANGEVTQLSWATRKERDQFFDKVKEQSSSLFSNALHSIRPKSTRGSVVRGPFEVSFVLFFSHSCLCVRLTSLYCRTESQPVSCEFGRPRRLSLQAKYNRQPRGTGDTSAINVLHMIDTSPWRIAQT